MINSYRAPITEYLSLLDVIDGIVLDGMDSVTIRSVLDNAARFAQEQLYPINSVGDEIHCQYDPATGKVKMPPGFKSVYDQYVSLGYTRYTGSESYGGLALPKILWLIINEMFISANCSFMNLLGLAEGAISAIEFSADDWLKSTYLPQLISGQICASMCLTEPHCGTDLGLITTKALVQEDGSYQITGNKIWITYGEHDLTDNIVHLVLAKLPDAPVGSKGISLFLVPKILSNGQQNQLKCIGLEKKLGQHASPACQMQFDAAEGYLIGQVNHGLSYMFVMKY